MGTLLCAVAAAPRCAVGHRQQVGPCEVGGPCPGKPSSKGKELACLLILHVPVLLVPRGYGRKTTRSGAATPRGLPPLQSCCRLLQVLLSGARRSPAFPTILCTRGISMRGRTAAWVCEEALSPPEWLSEGGFTAKRPPINVQYVRSTPVIAFPDAAKHPKTQSAISRKMVKYCSLRHRPKQ